MIDTNVIVSNVVDIIIIIITIIIDIVHGMWWTVSEWMFDGCKW